MQQQLFSLDNNFAQNLLPFDGEAFYLGTILGIEDAQTLFNALKESIPWEQDLIKVYGRQILTKRKTAWFADKRFAYTYSHQTKIALPWTPELHGLKQLVEAKTDENYNACLLNLYHDGAEGMAWHSDDESTIVPDSAIASVSLGALRDFDFRHKQKGNKIRISLANGSLLVMKGKCQTFWQHALPKRMKLRSARINLTFRKMIDYE